MTAAARDPGNGPGTTKQKGRRRRLQRGELTRELIVRASLSLLDTEGISGFSTPRLGRALGADPTAIYRHFASKDDLVLAIADHLLDEAPAGFEPRECWVQALEDCSRRLRGTYRAHPAAASLSAYRITQGPAEMRAVNTIVDAALRAGFEGAEAAVVYRALADFNLSWAGCEASFLALDESLQDSDRSAWNRTYLGVEPTGYPAIWAVREHLPDVADDAIYETVLAFVLAGLCARAPRPCTCPRHPER